MPSEMREATGETAWNPNAGRSIMLAIAVLSMLYLLQIVSPLRLDTDSVRFLIAAIGLADNVHVTAVNVPLGYPAIVATMERVGIASAPSFVALNIAFIALGLGAVRWIAAGDPPSVWRWTVLMTLLSYPIIRGLPMPLPDHVYLGISLGAVAAMHAAARDTERNKILLLLVALGLIVWAGTMRLAALALVPPFIWSMVLVIRSQLGFGSRRFWKLFGLGAAAVGIIVVAAVALTQQGTLVRYADEVDRVLSRSPLEFAAYRFRATMRGLGVTFANFALMRIPPLRPWTHFVGLIPTLLIILWGRRAGFRGPAAVYVVTYIVVLIVWPFYEPRLWIPIIPLLVLYGVRVARSFPPTRRVRIAVAAYVALYAVGGITSLAYITRATLAGKNFMSVYGRRGGLASPGHEKTMHDTYAKIIIQRFDGNNAAWSSLRTAGSQKLKEGGQ